MLPYNTCACVLDTGICITKPQCDTCICITKPQAYSCMSFFGCVWYELMQNWAYVSKIETLKLVVSKIKWKIPVRVIRYGWTTRPDWEIVGLKHTAVQTHRITTHVYVSQNLKHTIICQCKWTQSANHFRPYSPHSLTSSISIINQCLFHANSPVLMVYYWVQFSNKPQHNPKSQINGQSATNYS